MNDFFRSAGSALSWLKRVNGYGGFNYRLLESCSFQIMELAAELEL